MSNSHAYVRESAMLNWKTKMIEKAWKRYCAFQLKLEKDEEYQLLRGRFLNQQILFQGWAFACPFFMKGTYMRLDKYLKVTRLIKRRTVANEACDAEKVSVNGRPARASYDVKVGDIIEINMGTRPLKVKVLNVTEHATKENAAENYVVIE